jgi:hypothetical protein
MRSTRADAAIGAAIRVALLLVESHDILAPSTNGVRHAQATSWPLGKPGHDGGLRSRCDAAIAGTRKSACGTR